MKCDPPFVFSALIDSGSSDCFIDTELINKHNLETYSVPPMQLRLFDGMTNHMITRAVDLPVHFITGDITLTTFYVTPLDGSCTIVLGHNWLARYNPLIDWAQSSITFRTSEQSRPTPQSSPETPLRAAQSADAPNPTANTPCDHDRQAPSIEIVSPAAFARAA